MKKLLIVAFIGLLCSGQAFALFGLKGLIKGELNAVKGEFDTRFDKIETKFDTQIKLQNEMSAKVNANANLLAGVNNKVMNISSGRDTVTNDTELMKYIVYSLSGLCMALIVGLIGILKKLVGIGVEKKFYKEQLGLKVKDVSEWEVIRELQENFKKNSGKSYKKEVN